MNNHARAFTYRAGVRVQGTIVACDATAGSDLIFLSHARALGARAARALPRARGGKRQVLATELTLALLGPPGDRRRPCALLAPLGRPFGLGSLRLELFASGAMPGAASLLCEAGARRVVYAGPIGPNPGVRPAQALCVDATFGWRRFSFPPPAEALAQLRSLVTEALAARRAPVVLFDSPGSALDAGRELAAAGIAVRAHRTFLQAASVFGGAGLAAPALQRFEGQLKPGEALLWPREARGAPRLRALTAPVVVLASPWAAEPAAMAGASADHGVLLSERADFAGLVRYVEASGASEVALVGSPGDELAAALRSRGADTYVLGPPRQIALFATAGAPAT